jgi:hypothetical protein
MMTLDAAERALAALEAAEDRDLPPEAANDATLRLLLWRLRGQWPSRAAVEALRIATARERGRRRERRGAAGRRERRAQAAEAARRRVPARRRDPDVLLRELLAAPEWGLVVALAWEAAWLLAHCAVQQARWTEGAARAPALPGLPRDTRGRRKAAELLADYCRAKRVPDPLWAGEVLDLARRELPRAALAWINAAHPQQIAALAEDLVRLRWAGGPLHSRLATLLADGAACQAEWPELGRAEAGPPRGLLPLPPPGEDEEPASGGGGRAAAPPGWGP